MAQRLWLSPVARYGAVFLLCVISYLAGVRHLISITQPRSHPLWKSLFTRSDDTYIVPADSALLLLEAMKHENVTPDIYERRSFNADPDPAAGFAGVLISHFYTRPYTSMVDLQAIRELTALPESAAANVKVVFARDLHTEQIKSSSVILLGASNANPWVALFDPQMSFHLHYQMGVTGYEVLNSKPSHGEPDRYPYENSDPLHRAYGVVSFLPSLGGKGHVLILQGTTMAGTQAAIDFVLHRDDLLGPVLDAARTSTGNLRPFEVLLQTQNVANSATGVKVISVHLD